MMSRLSSRKSKGFTLIEMLIVMTNGSMSDTALLPADSFTTVPAPRDSAAPADPLSIQHLRGAARVAQRHYGPAGGECKGIPHIARLLWNRVDKDVPWAQTGRCAWPTHGCRKRLPTRANRSKGRDAKPWASRWAGGRNAVGFFMVARLPKGNAGARAVDGTSAFTSRIGIGASVPKVRWRQPRCRCAAWASAMRPTPPRR